MTSIVFWVWELYIYKFDVMLDLFCGQISAPILLLPSIFGYYTIVNYLLQSHIRQSYCVWLQNVTLAKVALRPGAGDLVNGILRRLVVLKVCHLLYPLWLMEWHFKVFMNLWHFWNRRKKILFLYQNWKVMIVPKHVL